MTPWLFLLLFGVSPADNGYTYPPEQRGDIAVYFTVAVPEGAAPIHYTLTVRGNTGLEVEPPSLSDEGNAWKVHRSTAWMSFANKVTWTEEIELEQVKPGFMPLPDVSIRFRDGPKAEWEQAEWRDILGKMRETDEPKPPPPPTRLPIDNWRKKLWPAVAAVVLFAMTLALLLLLRGIEPPLSPDQQALFDLDQLEQANTTPGHGSEWFYTQLSEILRRYLVEHFSMPVLQQTTDEFLQTIRTIPALANQEDFLRNFLEYCDLAKFAGVNPDASECHRTADQVRIFIRETAAAGTQK